MSDVFRATIPYESLDPLTIERLNGFAARLGKIWRRRASTTRERYFRP